MVQAVDSNRRLNLTATLAAIHAHRCLPRSEITRSTGLSRSSIAGAVAELESAEVVRQLPPTQTAQAGRPSPNVEPTDRFVVAAVNVDIDGVRAGIYGLGDHLLARASRPRARPMTPAAAAELVAEVLAEFVDVLQGRTLVGISAAVPGMVDKDGLVVETAPTLAWKDVPFAAMLGDATGVPAHVVYDAVAGLAAEQLWGHARTADDVLYLYGGPGGVGAAVMVDGNILHGHAGRAGRLGHLPVTSPGARCPCGGRGCLAVSVSAGLLATACRADSNALDDIRVGLTRATGSDRRLARFYRQTASALRTIVLAYNPEVIILDGFFGLLHQHRPQRLHQLLVDTGVNLPAELPTLQLPRHGANRLLAGASHFAFREFIADPRIFVDSP